MVKMNIFINVCGCMCNFYWMLIRYVMFFVLVMLIKMWVMVDVLYLDRYFYCNLRVNFINFVKYFVVYGSWNIWVDVLVIIIVCYIL